MTVIAIFVIFATICIGMVLHFCLTVEVAPVCDICGGELIPGVELMSTCADCLHEGIECCGCGVEFKAHNQDVCFEATQFGGLNGAAMEALYEDYYSSNFCAFKYEDDICGANITSGSSYCDEHDS